MGIKSSKELVSEALSQIKTLTTSEALELVNKDQCNLIDLRDVRELEKMGRIENSHHIPRGMLEFWIDPESPYHKQFFNANYHFIFYCASDWRSALATLSAMEIGLLNTSHLVGGFNKWLEEKGPIEKPR